MGATKTSLSAGEIIRKVLTEDTEVKKRSRGVFPVVAFDAILPYVVYRRTQLDQTPAKLNRGADTVGVEVICYAEQYTDGVLLAEAVRAALDGKQAEADGVVMRGCYLVDSEEAWADDAFMQQLVFNIKI